jgi:hypothetical protein
MARRLRWPPDTPLIVRQLAGAWLCGCVLMGTVAWGFLSAQVTAVPVASRLSLYAPCPGHGAPCAYPSFSQLMPLARLAVLVLLALLFVALAVLSRWTAGASWLTGDARARLLWVLLVMGGGLAGWTYAAVVTYAAGFDSTTQLVLAYTAGGLPFTLVAGLLLRPWRVNVVAGAPSGCRVLSSRPAGGAGRPGSGPASGPPARAPAPSPWRC